MKNQAVLICAAVGFVSAFTLGAPPPPEEYPAPGHFEKISLPPASDDILSRRAETAAAVVVFNGYVSVQANVNAMGNNVVGDAANEPSMAIDPNSPNRIAIGWRQFDSIASNFRQAGIAYSTDYGQTWTFPGVLDPGQFRSDPVLGADAFGNFYYSSLSTVETAEVFKSTDGGANWGAPVDANGGDKQLMAVDARDGRAGDGRD